METMYDRLGDLLNETLEAGHVKFVKPKPVEDPKECERKAPEIESSDDVEDSPMQERGRAFKSSKSSEAKVFFKTEEKATGTIIKAVPQEVERACRLLGITVSATKEEAKKAYKEKLQYYHPDKHAGNFVLEKIATDKTRQVVESYELIIKYLER